MLWPRQYLIYAWRPIEGTPHVDKRTSVNPKEAAREYLEDLHLEDTPAIAVFVLEEGTSLTELHVFNAEIVNEEVFDIWQPLPKES